MAARLGQATDQSYQEAMARLRIGSQDPRRAADAGWEALRRLAGG